MNDIARVAEEWIGTPFTWGQSVKGRGCDCKGLVAGVARDCGRSEGNSIEALAQDYGEGRFKPERLKSGLRRLFDEVHAIEPGDILLLVIGGAPQHLALAVGNGRIVHCYPSVGKVVKVPLGRRPVDSIWRWKNAAS